MATKFERTFQLAKYYISQGMSVCAACIKAKEEIYRHPLRHPTKEEIKMMRDHYRRKK